MSRSRLTHGSASRTAGAWSLALALLVGSVPHHAHGLHLGELDGLAPRTIETAADHPSVPHHIEATESVQERSCPACFSSTHSSGTPAFFAAPLPSRSSILLTSRDVVITDRAAGAFSARGPPGA